MSVAVKGLDDESGGSAPLTLVAKDKSRHVLTKRAARMSNFIQTAIQDGGDLIELEHVDGDVVAKLVEFMSRHEVTKMREIEKPLKSTDLHMLVDGKDAAYADAMDHDTLFKVMLAANYMDIPPLLSLMCAKVATMLKGKTAKEIRETFHIRDDATPEELAAIRREYQDLLE